MTDEVQLSLFDHIDKEPNAQETSSSDAKKPQTKKAEIPVEHQPRLVLNERTPLEDAIVVYLDDLESGGASRHTVRAFKSDLNLLGKFHGYDTPLNVFDTKKLNRWLYWLTNERDKPCSSKTYARRITTIKNFFGYLVDQRVLKFDPAVDIHQRSVSSKLPEVLSQYEAQKLLNAARKVRYNAEKPDVRPYFLVLLLLQTGIKKAECMRLTTEDFGRHGLSGPYVNITYDKPNMRYKERRISIDDELLEVMQEYVSQRQVENILFDCTPRNLEYVLRDVGKMAAVHKSKISFESLRWTSALNDFLDEMDEEDLRQKMGLSRISWRETSAKLDRLATQN